ncbi:DedA family protein [Streptomyces sp. NPDC060194]|uniref:DedA family protein n=1 Tax=Streptomyces sp. NPDC060194 TaxID=3347069 RepID=UPI003668F9C1
MLETVGALATSPWVYAAVAVSIVLDVFLPVMPSGVLLIAAATATSAAEQLPHPVSALLALLLCAAVASLVGDVLAYRLAWRGGERLNQALARSRRLATAQERLGAAVARGGGVLVVIARFAPAGRSVMSLAAGSAHRRAKEFLPWSALAGVTWAAYSICLGYFGGQWLGASWLTTGVSLLALVVAGSAAAHFMRRPTAATAPVSRAH